MKKVIPNIMPFNDMFYRDCLYNSLFPIIRSYGLPLDIVLSNEIEYYFFNARKEVCPAFGVQYVDVKPLKQMLADWGVSVIECDYQSNIVQAAHDSINNDNAVIVWVDCYYISIRKDTYKKQHFAHTLLIYGYDHEEKVFLAIEHTHHNSLTYQSTKIPYQDVIQGLNGFICNFQSDISTPSYLEFSYASKKCEDNSYLKKQYVNNIAINSELIHEGINQIFLIAHHLYDSVSTEQKLLSNREHLIASLNNLINGKRSQLYKAGLFFAEDKLRINLHKLLVVEWEKIRMNIYKYAYTNHYRAEDFYQIPKNIENIVGLEQQLVALNQMTNK